MTLRACNGQAASRQIASVYGVIERLAREGRALRWDAACEWYEVRPAPARPRRCRPSPRPRCQQAVNSPTPQAQVTNGPLFKTQFNHLRYKRGKRRETAVDRPFAAMHEHFVLVSRPPLRSRPDGAPGRLVMSPYPIVTSPDRLNMVPVAWSCSRIAQPRARIARPSSSDHGFNPALD